MRDLSSSPGALVAPAVPGRGVHTFKHRRGRITAGQATALEKLWPRYGLPVTPAPLAAGAVFGRTAPLVLEIGFGMGEATLAMAAADPGRDVLAVDVHTPGAGALLRALDAGGHRNVRVVLGDALDVLTDMIPPGSLDGIRVFFPDPWPKACHHKRRLVGPGFAHLAASRLHAGGTLHLATDWDPYAAEMVRVVNGEPLLANDHGGYAPRPGWRPVTRFERQGLDKGHTVRDLIARRVPDA